MNWIAWQQKIPPAELEQRCSMWLEAKAKEAKQNAGAAPCPFPRYIEHRQDQIVAEWCHCTVMEARVLAESELDLFNDYLFEAVATGEARIIADAIAAANAKNDASHKKAAQSSIGK